MKNSLKILFVILVIVLPIKVKALYKVTHIATHSFGNLYNSQYRVTNESNAFVGYSYCMAPGKPSGSINSNPYARYTDSSTVVPYNSKYELALSIAYTTLVNDGYIKSSSQSGGVISAIFRLISDYYGALDRGGIFSQVQPYIVNKNLTLKYANIWNLKNSSAKYAYNTFKKVINLVNNTKGSTVKAKYDNLIANNNLFEDKWEFTLKDKKIINNTKFDLTILVKPINISKSNVNWKNFKIECKYNYSCKLISNNNGTFVIRVSTNNVTAKDIKKANNAGVKYGIYLTTSFNSIKNINGRIKIIKSSVGDQAIQKMILVNSSPRTINTKIPINFNENESCKCLKNSNGEYEDKFIIETDNNGVISSELLDFNDPKVANYDCPPSSTCQNICEIITDSSGIKKYYDSNGNIVDKVYYDIDCDDKVYKCQTVYEANGKPVYFGNNGNIVDKKTYRSQCLHICETPSASNGNKYYCSEKVDGQGGKECSEKQYNEECYCPPLKDKCENNPSDPACVDYPKKCPNCNASISMPGSCNNFDTDSKVTGYINDINQEKTSCNQNINPVKQCVIDGKDQSGNSYEATNELKNNRYCKVWCDESYQFDVPTARYSTSGGYFTLSTKISGTRNCYLSSADDPTVPLDSVKFENDLNELNKNLYTAWNEWSKWNTLFSSSAVVAMKNNPNESKVYKWSYNGYDINDKTYKTFEVTSLVSYNDINMYKTSYENSYKNISNTIKNYLTDFNNCTSGWQNNMVFNPTIEFTYHEEEYDKIGNGIFSLTGNVETTMSNTYCLGDTNDQYDCLSGQLTSSDNNIPSSVYKNINYVTCDASGCKNVATVISQAKWIKKTTTKSAIYTPSQNFSTYHQYGTVKTGSVCDKTGYNNCLWTRLPADALPVELKTGKGAFPFVLKYSNIGESNSDSSLGRLIGKENAKSVLTEYNKLPEAKKCTNPSNKTYFTQETGYVCAYINNCDNCGVGCEGDNCTIHETCEGECPISCKTCIFDGNNTTYKFRTVSLNNIFPNACDESATNCPIGTRKNGYNWQTLKAKTTQKEIEDNGNMIYEDPEYSYILSPSQLNAIKDYNKRAGTYENTTIPKEESNGGEDAYKCQKITFNGLDYSVNCESTFLNENTGKYFTEIVRNKSGFKLWTETDYCPNGNCLSRKDGIGPSWK